MGKKIQKSQIIESLLLMLLVVFFMGTFSGNMVMAQADIVISASGDTTGITDYNNLMNELNPALGATANIRCVAGAELNDGEAIELADFDDFYIFEFDFDEHVTLGKIPVPVSPAFTKEEVAVALADAINSSGIKVDAITLPSSGFNIAWILLTQEIVGTWGNGLSISETVANPFFIAQETFDGGSDGPGPNPGAVISLAVGNYYISRTVRVEGFNGTMQGAGKDATIVEAVREFPETGGGFGFAHDPYWGAAGYPMMAGHFLFLFPENIIVEDLTLQVKDPNPCDSFYSSGVITGLAGFALEIAGSTPGIIPDIVVRDVKVLGDAGDVSPKNLNLTYAIFVLLGGNVSENYRGKGNVIIENCYVSHAAWRGIVMGSLMDDSSGVIKGCTVENSGHGIRVIRVNNSRCKIHENTFSNVWWYPAYISDVTGAEIRDNAFSGGTLRHLFLQWCSAVTVRGNTFQDFNGIGLWYTVPIYVRTHNQDCVISGNEFINISGAPTAIVVAGRGNLENNTRNSIVCNDYRQSNLLGWTSGSGCVLLDPNTTENIVAECLFPVGTTALEQIRDLGINNQTLTCSEGSVYLLNEIISEVERLVEERTLNKGQGNSLIKKLDGAIKQIYQGKNNPACNKLGAFINEVDAYIKSGKLTPEEGQSLIDAANIVITCLGG